MFDIKVVLIVCDDLVVWQKFNVVVFFVMGVVVGVLDVFGEFYEDVVGCCYSWMLGQLMLVFVVDLNGLQVVYWQVLLCELMIVFYVCVMFLIGYDVVNCVVFCVEDVDNFDLVGLVLYGLKKVVDKVVKGLVLYV